MGVGVAGADVGVAVGGTEVGVGVRGTGGGVGGAVIGVGVAVAGGSGIRGASAVGLPRASVSSGAGAGPGDSMNSAKMLSESTLAVMVDSYKSTVVSSGIHRPVASLKC